MPLTDTLIRNTKRKKRPVKLADGHGLYLVLQPTGKKLWRYRYRIDGKENVFAAGEYVQAPPRETVDQVRDRVASGRMTLSEARVERVKWRALVKQGVPPAREREQQRRARAAENANTFEAVAIEWLDAKARAKKWGAQRKKKIETLLRDDVYPYIGALPIRSVTAAHLLEILRRIEGRGAPTVALLARQWCSGIFNYAVTTLRANGDPTGALKGAVEQPKVKHNTPLARAQIAPFLRALDGYKSSTTVVAMKLLLLTFVRSKELRGAQWSEIDFDGAEWRIPAERMKNGETHVVPLSRQALGLLRTLHPITGEQLCLFPNIRRRDSYMAATTFHRVLETIGYHKVFTPHGLRATASTALHEMGYHADVIERQLAHQERNRVRAAYDHSQRLEERRQMMQQWADYIDALCAGENVIGFRRVAA